MTDKASPAGWVVQVSTQEPGEGAPKFEYFNVAIDAADKAVDAVKKKAKAADNTHISTVRGLSSPELASLAMRAGEVKPHDLQETLPRHEPARLTHRVQLTSDGHKPYLDAVETVFGDEIDYACCRGFKVKGPEAEKRYSPAECIGCEKRIIT